MKRVMLYGAGHVAKSFISFHNFIEAQEEIINIIETDKTKDYFEGYKVISVDKIDESVDRIYIVNQYIGTLKKLLEKGFDKSKITICNEVTKNNYVKEYGILELDIDYDEEFAISYKEKYVGIEYVVTQRMKKNIDIFSCSDVKRIMGRSYVESYDYCRHGVLRLIIDEIMNNDIQGELAEVGVFRGDFSKYINLMFPNRRLYLFDTFEGFKKDELEDDLKNGYMSKDWVNNYGQVFDETSPELILRKMKNSSQCVIRKGWFPDTVEGLEENKYALVSLDCDLYGPTLSGLRYFYPRLNQGGYIMIHDYNNSDRELKGVKKAVLDYEKEIGSNLCKVPIPDICGSLVISR